MTLKVFTEYITYFNFYIAWKLDETNLVKFANGLNLQKLSPPNI